jgi:hypothetical protein
MRQILNENKEILFEGDVQEMDLAFKYLTQPFYLLAETMGLRMVDAYRLNDLYWNDATRKAKHFTLVDA